MRLANRLQIRQPSQWDSGPARLVLIDDEGDEMDGVPLAELFDALEAERTRREAAGKGAKP